MIAIQAEDCALHVAVDGPTDGRVVMFANSIGTDMRVWDAMLPHLPAGLRIVRFDKRGHGLSDCPPGPYEIDDLVRDASSIIDAFGLRDVTFVGLSIGGLIGQGLAARRPDVLHALVLMDTAARIGTPEMWRDRIEQVQHVGMTAMADRILDRWFIPANRQDPGFVAPWRNMLSRTPAEGYAGCCAAIAGSDFTETTKAMSMPVLAIAGADDMATTPELVRATADLCGAAYREVAAAGHLPCVEQPAATAQLIADFLKETEDA